MSSNRLWRRFVWLAQGSSLAISLAGAQSAAVDLMQFGFVMAIGVAMASR